MPEVGIVLDVSDEVGQNRVSRGFALLPRGWIPIGRRRAPGGSAARRTDSWYQFHRGGATVPAAVLAIRQARTANFWHRWHVDSASMLAGVPARFPSPTLPQAAPIPDAA